MKSDATTTMPTVVFPADAVRILRELPEGQRYTVTQAVMSAFVLGEDRSETLNGFEKLIYFMVADTIRRAHGRLAV